MSVKNYTITLCDRREIKEFIETYHYSKNINGLKSNYCFKMLDNNNLIGAMMYGQIGMAGVWKKYVDNETDLIELRRLCCIDDTPKNTENYLSTISILDLSVSIFIKSAFVNFNKSNAFFNACFLF